MKPLVNLEALQDNDDGSTVPDMTLVKGTAYEFQISSTDPSHIVNSAINGNMVHFISSGKWSMHDILLSALEHLAPASLHFSTFSITEFPARVLAQCIDAGQLKEVNMLLDYRAKVRYPAVYQIANNISNKLAMLPVHAKVAILESDKGFLTIIGSANWTENPRIEAGTITNDQQAGIFHKEWILKAIEHGDIFNTGGRTED